MEHTAENDAPTKGEVWRWAWLSVTILTAGPKRVTWRATDGEVGSTPTDRFLARFQRTGLGRVIPPGKGQADG